MLALQCMHDNLLKRHSFCWALYLKWYSLMRIDEENPCQTRPREQVIYKGGQGQDKIGGAHLCQVGIAMHT